ncbi:phosphotriesterase family protein, partial [Streptomyces sp. NPDC005070]
MSVNSNTVNTVLGPVPAGELGVVSVHEALLSVLPGAEHAFDITLDRAEIFGTLARKLRDFRAHGGGTIVDSTGMFHGRDVRLYEALSRATGVHIVASTGQGPEELLGGYFLTPQTNPPTPWPAEKFAGLFTKEITEGMVVPRVERRGLAGLVTTAVTR